jgi:hypothetical protein
VDVAGLSCSSDVLITERLLLAPVVQGAVPHLRPVVVDDRGRVLADLVTQAAGGGGRQPGRGPVQLPYGHGLVADRLLRRADRLPLRSQGQGQYQQVHRRQRGPEEADGDVLRLELALPDQPGDGGRDDRAYRPRS